MFRLSDLLPSFKKTTEPRSITELTHIPVSVSDLQHIFFALSVGQHPSRDETPSVLNPLIKKFRAQVIEELKGYEGKTKERFITALDAIIEPTLNQSSEGNNSVEIKRTHINYLFKNIGLISYLQEFPQDIVMANLNDFLKRHMPAEKVAAILDHHPEHPDLTIYNSLDQCPNDVDVDFGTDRPKASGGTTGPVIH